MTRREAAGLNHPSGAASAAAARGSASYRGYEFQKEVTVWVALCLLFDSGSAAEAEIFIEPASEDDIEAKLEVPPEHASATVAVHGPLSITMQIKFRGSGHWSAKAFKQLVEDRDKKGPRGPKPRMRAKGMLLADARRRYVLITNVSVDHTLSEGRIQRPDSKPAASFVPPGVAGNIEEQAALVGRFAIIESLTSAHLRAELRRLLESIAHVPSTRVDEATTRLKREVTDRLLGLAAPLTRMGIEAILQNAGGLPHIDRELAEYVPPAASSFTGLSCAR